MADERRVPAPFCQGLLINQLIQAFFELTQCLSRGHARYSFLEASAPMKLFALLSRGLLALSLGLAAWPGLADDDCDAPVHQWQSREALRQMAAAQGWQVHRLKIDDGCYEVRGTDAQGRRFKARIDPQSLKILKIRQGEHERARAGRAQPDR